MGKSRFAPYVVPAVLWGYLCSALLAKRFWGAVFDKAILAFDLSPNQAWFLPLIVNLLVAAIAVPSVVKYLVFLRRGTALSVRQHVTYSLCLGGVLLSLRAAVVFASVKQKQFTAAVGEFIGGEAERLFAAGELGQGSYSNAVIGLSLRFPEDWHAMSLNAIARAKYSGAQAAFGKDTEQARVLTEARQGIYSLLAVRKYPQSEVGYSPSLSLNAYDKKAVAATGMHSLEDYANSFAAVSGPYHARSEPVKESFAGTSGYHIHIEVSPRGTIQQHVYVTETETLYVVLVASVMEDSDLATLKEAVSTLRIQRK